jgi:hypothetical protein
MRQLFAFAIILGLSFSVSANDFAALIGARTNSWDYAPATTGISGSGSTGFQAGVLGFLNLTPVLQLRSGFIYTQRIFSITNTGVETDYTLTYFDVPLTLKYMFSEYGGVFFGPNLALGAGKSCTGGNACTTDGVKSSLVGMQLGASFKFAPQLGAELYYELTSGDIMASNGTSGKDAKSIVANLLFTFE